MGRKEGKKQPRLSRVAEILSRKAATLREYEVIRGPEELQGPPTDGIPQAWVYELEYEKALRLRKQLVRKYRGKTLENAIPGEVVSNDYGECYCIVDECSAQLRNVDCRKSREAMVSNLKLVYGIGPVWEGELKQQGYLTIEDLREHPKWKDPAHEFLRMIDDNDIRSLQDWLWRRLPKSHALVHCLAGLCRYEDFAILDIETLGLFGRPIVLFGIAKPKKGGMSTSQWLLRDISDEPAALWEFISNLEERMALISFNGRAFDLPFVQERLGFYGMEAHLDNPHFDTLHFARRAWRDQLPDCRLGTIEKSMGVQRDIDVPSALVPTFYETYLKTRNVGPLVAIVEHNKQDLITLANLFSKLNEAWTL